MDAKAILKLYQYHHWANRKVWVCVEKLTDEQFHRPHDYSIGSVFRQTYHLMTTELYTVSFFEKSAFDEMKSLQEEDFTARSVLRSRWDEYIRRVDDALKSLTDAQLHERIRMQSSSRTLPEMSLWECLIAMINHSMDHRSQILALIHQLGGETCEHGIFFFLLER